MPFGFIEEAQNTAARGVDRVDRHATQANVTAARGVDVAHHQAAQANATAAHGVNVAHHQAAQANATAAHGVDVAAQQAAAANATAAEGVEMIDEHIAAGVNVAREQAATANATAADGINMLETQTSMANATIDRHLNNLTPAAENLMNNVHDQIDLLSTPLKVIAALVGPLQILTGANLILTMLQTLNVIRGVQGRLLETAQGVKLELEKLTNAVKGVRDVLHAGTVVQIARHITGELDPSTTHKPVVDEKARKIQCFAFYSSAASCVSQLKGAHFWAYSSINELFSMILEFNSLSKISNAADGVELHLKVFFLDPQPEHPMTIPYFYFAGDNIHFVSHSDKKESIVFQRIFVASSSQMRLENIKVDSLVSLGRTTLVNCSVQHDPQEFIPAPPLKHPAIVSVPYKQDSYSVGNGSESIKYDQCVFAEKRRSGLSSKLSSLTSKKKIRFITNLCSKTCTVSVAVVAEEAKLDLNPGQCAQFQRKYNEKNCLGSWISMNILGAEIGSSSSAMIEFQKGHDLPNLLLLHDDDGTDIIKRQVGYSKASEAVGYEHQPQLGDIRKKMTHLH